MKPELLVSVGGAGKLLKDTIPSWKKDFVANHFCHNAAHSPNIHCVRAAMKRREKTISNTRQQGEEIIKQVLGGETVRLRATEQEVV